jgi:hypothetical protein
VTGREFGADGCGPAGLGLSERDFDLLADYLGDALDDPTVEAQIARRIEDDPVWHRAHAALAEATAAVSADLETWGRTAEPMPVDVADRLTHALAAQDPPKAGRVLSVVPGEGRSAARPRRRARRWVGPLTAAAAVLAVCGLGLSALPNLTSGSSDAGSASDSAASAPEIYDQEAPAEGGDRALVPVRQRVASGNAYSRESLDESRRKAASRAADPAATLAEGDVFQAAAAPPALERLTEPAALSDCLAALGAAQPQTPTAIDVVDYATFEGSPALIVFFTDAARARWVWVAAPDCGTPGADPDARYSAKVS